MRSVGRAAPYRVQFSRDFVRHELRSARAVRFVLGVLAAAFVADSGRAARLELAASVDVGVEHLTAAPDGNFIASDSESQPRSVASKTVRGGYGPLTFTSLGGDVSATYGNWVFSLLGGRFGGAIGPYSPGLRSVDGSPVRVRPWSAWHADVSAFGLRYRKTLRRWSVGVGVALGASILVVPADAGYGAESIPGNVLTPTWTLRGSIEGCRRMDPSTRACLVFTPYVHQYRWFDGGAIALRWEVG